MVAVSPSGPIGAQPGGQPDPDKAIEELMKLLGSLGAPLGGTDPTANNQSDPTVINSVNNPFGFALPPELLNSLGALGGLGGLGGLPGFALGATPGATSTGKLNLDVARQLAHLVATKNTVEPNVDPLVRIRYEELARIAELHVGDATGLLVPALATTPVVLCTPSEWAGRALIAYDNYLNALADALESSGGLLGGLDSDALSDADGISEDMSGDALRAMMNNFAQLLQPLLLGMQAGFMVGHLATDVFGQYDLPIPWTPRNELTVIPSHIDGFAAEWDLNLDDVRLYVMIHQIAMHAVIARPHVRQRLDTLLAQYCSGFSPDTQAIREKFEGLDGSDMAQIQDALNDPRELLAAMQTPQQLDTLNLIQAIVVAIVGYVDDVVAQTAPKLMPSAPIIDEALRRKRATESEGRRFVERLLGVELERAQYERGQRFVEGVRERDSDALDRLWRGVRFLPTPAEVDAPGLWLARTELDN